jgi:hypothetical protein
VSLRDDAIQTLVQLLHSAEDRDRVSAADKLLKSPNISRAYQEEALEVLEEIMTDPLAKPGDRVNAADKLKNHGGIQAPTARDEERQLAMMTDADLEAKLAEYEPPRRLAPAQDPLLD